MGSRLHGNDGHTHIVIPTTAGIHGHPYRHSREGGNPWRGGAGGDGSPSPRGRRWAPTIVIPRDSGGPGDGSPSPRERRWASTSSSRDSGRAAMGPRLHGNDGRTHIPATTAAAHPQSSAGIHGPHIVIPAKAGIHGGGPGGMGPRLHGNDGRTREAAGIHGHPYRHSREGGNPWRGGAGGDGSPSPRGRRWASTSSFPRQREGGDGFPSPRERRWAPTIVIPRDSGGPGDGFPSARERRAHPYRHSREGGNPWRGGAGGDGSPSPRGRRWATTSSFPRRRGGGDGFPPARERRLYNGPSPRERRWAQRAPTIVGGRSSCPWRGSGGTLCCRPTS